MPGLARVSGLSLALIPLLAMLVVGVYWCVVCAAAATCEAQAGVGVYWCVVCAAAATSLAGFTAAGWPEVLEEVVAIRL